LTSGRRLVTARVDAAGTAGVAGELPGGGTPGDVADLERDHGGQREPHPRHRGKKLNGQRRLKHTLDPVLEAGHLAVQTLDLLEQFPSGIGGVLIGFPGVCIILVEVFKVPPYVVVGLGLFGLGVIRRLTGRDRDYRP
jgi:hypothetical protein